MLSSFCPIRWAHSLHSTRESLSLVNSCSGDRSLNSFLTRFAALRSSWLGFNLVHHRSLSSSLSGHFDFSEETIVFSKCSVQVNSKASSSLTKNGSGEERMEFDFNSTATDREKKLSFAPMCISNRNAQDSAKAMTSATLLRNTVRNPSSVLEFAQKSLEDFTERNFSSDHSGLG